jgi:1,4-alpha-glucan branching enzyme
MAPPGKLAIVLHTHMPYVESGGPWPHPDNPPNSPNWAGFGTWPFGEEWLWEALATSYLPLLDVLGRAPVTLSLTPVLCDQLEAPGAIERCLQFLTEIRPESHLRDARALRAGEAEEQARELERAAGDYAWAAERLREHGSGLVAALGAQAGWTSAATHAVLPLLASDSAVALQVQTGIASHRRRFGDWRGGFWLPECAYEPWLASLLEAAGVRAACVELTGLYGLGDVRHLRPLATDEGPLLWPIDRQTMALVWSDQGYPSAGVYRDYHRHTEYRHHVWANDGQPYDHARACATARSHALDFVARVRERVAGGGVCVCALDTELLGHWWYEGVVWLWEVLDQAERQGLQLTTLDDALSEVSEPGSAAALTSAPAPGDLGATSWGAGGDLRAWSGPQVADLAWQARAAELTVLSCGGRPSDRALRELLALQSSDWAFLMTNALAGEYPRDRAAGHAGALGLALRGEGELEERLRNLAPELVGWEG